MKALQFGLMLGACAFAAPAFAADAPRNDAVLKNYAAIARRSRWRSAHHPAGSMAPAFVNVAISSAESPRSSRNT